MKDLRTATAAVTVHSCFWYIVGSNAPATAVDQYPSCRTALTPFVVGCTTCTNSSYWSLDGSHHEPPVPNCCLSSAACLMYHHFQEIEGH